MMQPEQILINKSKNLFDARMLQNCFINLHESLQSYNILHRNSMSIEQLNSIQFDILANLKALFYLFIVCKLIETFCVSYRNSKKVNKLSLCVNPPQMAMPQQSEHPEEPQATSCDDQNDLLYCSNCSTDAESFSTEKKYNQDELKQAVTKSISCALSEINGRIKKREAKTLENRVEEIKYGDGKKSYKIYVEEQRTIQSY